MSVLSFLLKIRFDFYDYSLLVELQKTKTNVTSGHQVFKKGQVSTKYICKKTTANDNDRVPSHQRTMAKEQDLLFTNITPCKSTSSAVVCSYFWSEHPPMHAKDDSAKSTCFVDTKELKLCRLDRHRNQIRNKPGGL